MTYATETRLDTFGTKGLSETTEIGIPRRISEKILLDKQMGTSADQSKVEDINKWIQK